MSRATRSLAFFVALIATACEPGDGKGLLLEPLADSDQPVARPSESADRARNERLAEGLAIAMRDAGFRKTIRLATQSSRYSEYKVHLQALLEADDGAARERMVGLGRLDSTQFTRDLQQAPALELYFPVPDHRRRWDGGTDLLVATALHDDEPPVAFDLLGRRLVLDPDTPPATPVLAVGHAEGEFEPRAERLVCLEDCDNGGGGGAGSGFNAGPGLYLTRTEFTGTFESWFKGSPEFELHVLGRDGASARLKTYQCIGEHAGGAYAFDQNSKTWTGTVLLFSQHQLDQYKSQHPGNNLQILVLEDDDTTCQVKVDSTRAANMLRQLDLAYTGLTAGKDTTDSFLRKAWRHAPGLYQLLAKVASFIKTDDDLVGNAIEDPAAAASFFPGATWVVKGENLVSNGALKLEMR